MIMPDGARARRRQRYARTAPRVCACTAQRRAEAAMRGALRRRSKMLCALILLLCGTRARYSEMIRDDC